LGVSIVKTMVGLSAVFFGAKTQKDAAAIPYAKKL
jgi:hypothetical protein